MKHLDKIEQLLTQCEQDLAKLTRFNEQLPKFEQNIQQLSHYYQTQYLKDVDNHQQSNRHYRILDQDSIWNTIEQQHQEKINILKTIINKLK